MVDMPSTVLHGHAARGGEVGQRVIRAEEVAGPVEDEEARGHRDGGGPALYFREGRLELLDHVRFRRRHLAHAEDAAARARDGLGALDEAVAQGPRLLRRHVLAEPPHHLDPRREQLRLGPALEPGLEEGVVGGAGGDAGLLGALEDQPPLARVDRAVRPGHLGQRHQGERGHGLGPDAELEQLVEDGLVLDPGGLGEGLARGRLVAELAETLGESLVLLAEEFVLERADRVAEDLRVCRP